MLNQVISTIWVDFMVLSLIKDFLLDHLETIIELFVVLVEYNI
jgi:hypothetical protein